MLDETSNTRNIFEKAEVFFVDHSDLNNFIEQHTEFSVECALDQSNGSIIDIDVTGEMSEKDLGEFELFKENGWQEDRTLDQIMNYMAEKGIIEKGRYLIQVYW